MTQVILKWVFDFDFEKNEPFEKTLERARAFDNLEGLVWKVWLRDRTTNRGGGIYLFENREAAQAWVDRFKDKPTQAWTANPVWEILEVEETLSKVTFATLARAQRPQDEAVE